MTIEEIIERLEECPRWELGQSGSAHLYERYFIKAWIVLPGEDTQTMCVGQGSTIEEAFISLVARWQMRLAQMGIE